LRLDLPVGDDAFGDQQLRQGIGIAGVLTISMTSAIIFGMQRN